MSKKVSLSISMIVKNEEMHIGRILENAHLFADEIIVLDTGSTDKTIEIARTFGATIKHFEWCFDFAKARNASLSYCTKDFVLWLDADDLLPVDDAIRLRALLSEEIRWDALYLPYYYNYNPEKPNEGIRKKTPRIFRNHIGAYWFSPIHEYLNFPPHSKRNRAINDIGIYHYPLRKSGSNALRNLFIMHKAAKEPENLGTSYHYWHIAKEYGSLRNRLLAIKYYKLALQNGIFDGLFQRARQYHGLGRQFYSLQEYSSAIEAFALCAMNYPYWREPFMGIVESYYALGEYAIALTYLAIAERIAMHDMQIERSEIYTEEVIAKFQTKLISAQKKNSIKLSATEKQESVYKLLAGGDVYLGNRLSNYIASQGSAVGFKGFEAFTMDADAFLVNLQCVVSNTGSLYDKGDDNPIYYRGHPVVIEALIDAGINVVTTANNHAMDYGREALAEQKEILTACHIASPGSGETKEEAAKAEFIAVGDIIIAVISIETEYPNLAVKTGRMGVSTGQDYQEITQILVASIAHAKQYANLVIVSPHWGLKRHESPSEAIIRLAHYLIDAGADLVLGHAADILQGIELYQNKLIVYDLGCLLADKISNQKMSYSALFAFEFSKSAFTKLKIYPLYLSESKVSVASSNNAKIIKSQIQERSNALGSNLTFREQHNCLEINIPEPSKIFSPFKKPLPEWVYHKKSLKKLSDHYLSRPNSAVVSQNMSFLRPEDCISLNDCISYLGCQFPVEVKTGYGFVVKVYFKVLQQVALHWEIFFELQEIAHPDNYHEFRYPITGGAYPFKLWKPSETILSESVLRPTSGLVDGKYQLSCKLFDVETQNFVTYVNDQHPMPVEKIVAGELLICSTAPEGVAGISFAF